MKPVTSLLTTDLIEDLASRSHMRYGKLIAEDGKITITKQNAFNIIATIENSNKKAQTTELTSTSKGFRWKCSCTNRKDTFCEHAVALALFVTHKDDLQQE